MKKAQRKLKICHLITRMIIGGAQENTLFSCRGQIANGHEVTLATGPTTGPEGKLLEEQNIEGLKVDIFPNMIRALNPLTDFKAYLDLKKYFKEQKFDVVHTHASKAGIIGRAAAWAAKIPVVVHTVHGPAFHRYEKAWRNKLYISAEKFAAKRCHKIVCVADAMTKQFLDAGISKAEMYRTVYSGMNLDDYLNLEQDNTLRDTYGIPADAIVIGKIARLFELKGHEYLIKAAKELVEHNSKVHFLLIGDGLLRSEIEEEIKKLGLEKHFHFSGLIPPRDVPKHTAAMDIVCHLSLREGLPRAVVQGLAAGKPVVAYNLDGAPEVVFDDETGYICPPESVNEVSDALKKLIDSSELRQKLGLAGRQLVSEKFNWQKMVDDLEEVYAELLPG
ncbi:MAG: glycosyltransferase family 4 protein [Lentisphaeraceae bacterium]|nr:glycosyltransferase family 4 protein [Lentisphaeraceae bacterium]